MVIITSTQTDVESSNSEFNNVADTSMVYIQNVKLRLEQIERDMFKSPDDYGEALKNIRKLAEKADDNPDRYKLTISLIEHYKNGRFDGFEGLDISDMKSRAIPEFNPRLH